MGRGGKEIGGEVGGEFGGDWRSAAQAMDGSGFISGWLSIWLSFRLASAFYPPPAASEFAEPDGLNGRSIGELERAIRKKTQKPKARTDVQPAAAYE